MVVRSRDDHPYIGRSLPRLEDERLLRGLGRYTDDNQLRTVAAVFLRSPHAHATIRRTDVSVAAERPGVLAVLTAGDYHADGHKDIHHGPVPLDVLDVSKPAFGQSGGIVRDTFMSPLAKDRVRFVGEPVAMIVAETAAIAADAIELAEVDYDVLPAVTTAHGALAADAPKLWPELPDNIGLEEQLGDLSRTDAALLQAATVIEGVFTNQRVANAQMEPRVVIGDYDAAADRYTLYASTQGVSRQRQVLAHALDVDPARVRVVTADVGGGFGPRSFLESESVLVCWAARRLGRPVRWRGDRSESFLTDYQGRDIVTRAALGFDDSGRATAIRIDILGNIGAHSVAYMPMANAYRHATTVYDIAAAAIHVRGVFTNTASTVAFRGAGRPEMTFMMERLMDLGARRMGMDRIELRRRNLVRRAAMPYRTAMGVPYDAGDFSGNLDQALRLADWAGFPPRRTASLARGRRRGIGLGLYVQVPAGAPAERVEVTIRPDGVVDVVAGTQSTGQGHETTFAQVVADLFGVEPRRVRLTTGDSDRVRLGGGTHSDRSMRLVGALLVRATEKLVQRAMHLAAEQFGVSYDQVTFDSGLFSIPGTNQPLDILDIARRRPHAVLSESADFIGRILAFPSGCSVCELEIDPDTGAVEIIRYCAVDDVGQAINPMIVEGQTCGGIAQGIGQALCEEVVWTPGTGQVLTGSFMDYAIPRADLLPAFDLALVEDPTQSNTLRVKGGGEGGIVPAPAAVMNAICDALAADGVEDLSTPVTPERVWRALSTIMSSGELHS